MANHQPSLFDDPGGPLPQGLRYAPAVIAPPLAADIATHLATLPFEAFDFHGFKGLRRVVSFGARYDFSASRLREAEPLPEFLQPARSAAADFADLDPSVLTQVLVTEYAPGAGIGWHRDRPEFDKVVGLSFMSEATLRLRQRREAGWRRAALRLEAGSAYLLDGAARREWEHSIAPGERLRYSVTFRSVRSR